MALHRLKPMAAGVVQQTEDFLNVHVVRDPESTGNSIPVEAQRDEWGTVYWFTQLLVGRYTTMYESRDQEIVHERYQDGRTVDTDTGIREDIYLFQDTETRPVEVIGPVTGLRRRTHFQAVSVREDFQEWYDLYFGEDTILGFMLPAGGLRRAVLHLSYHWYLQPDDDAAPWGEVVLWIHERFPPLTEDGARQLRPQWAAVRERRPVWRRAHDRIPQTPDTDPERWWIPQRTLTIPLPHSRLQAGWNWLRLGVRMEEPPPPARSHPTGGGEWLEYREGWLGLYCDLTRTVLEVEIGEPEPRRTVVHVAKRESARRRAPSATAVLRT